MLAIVSKNFNKIFTSLKFSSYIVKETFILSLIFAFLFYFILGTPESKIIILFLLVAVFNLCFIYLVGYKRKKDIEEIKSVVKAIRKNRLLNEKEIILSKSLKDLEGNIRAMSQRTQKDIANMTKLAQARSDFLGYVSHELRTPIFTIQGYLETLLNGAIDDPKVNRSFLQKAFHHSENLNTLLNDLIDISMIESGQMSLSFRYFNLYKFLSEIISEIKQTISKEDVTISLIQDNLDLEVYGDKEKLKQVIVNLTSNSLKYTNEGTIDLIVTNKVKYITITVKDTGIGIRKEDHSRIFERFYRTDRERSSSIPGTGLGLAIVKHILEAHNSSIEVNSELGVGSEFTFKLKKG